MRRAGLATARLALAVAPHARCIGLVAGSGNNGGDAIEAGRWLHLAGRTVALTVCSNAERIPADAAASLTAAQAAGVPITSLPALLQAGGCDLLVDGLLGIGAGGAPRAPLASHIEAINSSGISVLAIDLPSGLDGDTGQPLGSACIRADHTLSLLSLKPGLFTGRGRDHAGRVWFDGLGLDEAALGEHASAWLLGPPTPRPGRLHASHKGSFGDVGVVGGAASMTGAALLAARAALAAGAGRVFVDLLGDRGRQVDLRRPELMLRPKLSSDRALLQRMTLVVGCGGGSAVRAELPAALALAQRLVLDADALNAVAADSALQTALRARSHRRQASVLTPHPLEAARLLGCEVARVQSDRLAAAQELADRFGCVIVLKGSGSVVASPGERPGINSTGNAALATAGTGDVLAGWLGGLWGAATTDGKSENEAAIAAAAEAVWRHGAAAEAAGLAVLRADDLIERLASIAG